MRLGARRHRRMVRSRSVSTPGARSRFAPARRARSSVPEEGDDPVPGRDLVRGGRRRRAVASGVREPAAALDVARRRVLVGLQLGGPLVDVAGRRARDDVDGLRVGPLDGAKDLVDLHDYVAHLRSIADST
jgi:hypothetical protein